MDLFKLVGRIVIENKDANVDIDESTKKASNASEKMSSAFKKIGAAVATYFTVDAIKNFGMGCITAAADAEAASSQFTQVFGNLEGDASKSLAGIASEAGISENRLKGSFTQIAAFAKTTGMDTEDALGLSKRAMIAVADSAAFYDRSIEDTTESLQSFLKGNYENDAALGLSCTETTRNAAANKLYGKSFNDLSESQKQLTLLQMVEDANKASGALGQAARESDTWSNVTGNLKRAWTDFQAVIGSNILPAAVNVVKALAEKIADLAEKVPEVVAWFQKYSGVLAAVAAAIGTVVAGVGLYNAVMAVKAAMDAAEVASLGALIALKLQSAAATLAAVAPYILIAAAVAAVIAIGVLLYKNWDKIKEKAIELKDKLANIWENIKAAISEKVDAIKQALLEKWELIKSTVSMAVEAIKNGISQKFSAAKEIVVNIFNSIRDTVSFVWETIKNVVKFGIMFIVEIIQAAFNLITLPFRMIWENCKGIITTAWGAIKSTISKGLNAAKNTITNVWNAVKAVFSRVWNAIKTTVSTSINSIKSTITRIMNSIKSGISSVMNGIKSVFTRVWNAIKNTVTNVLNSIKSVITRVWNAAKNTVTNVMNSIKSVITRVWDSAKNSVTNAINGIKSTISTGLNTAKSTAGRVLDGIKSKFSNIFDSAKNIVSGAINKIKGFFNFSWSLPKLKLPHFSITGSFGINPPSVPHFGIEWYKKAYNDPMLLNNPAIFGYNPSTGRYMGGGDGSGTEVVTGANTLMNMIKKASSESNESSLYYLKKIIDMLADFFPRFLDALLDMDIVLDDGTIVGRLAPAVDKELGKIKDKKGRGR